MSPDRWCPPDTQNFYDQIDDEIEEIWRGNTDDRDVSKRIWNRYMKKFGDKYRLLKDENNIWHLKCKYGTIQLYSLTKQQLCFTAEFRSKRHKTCFKKTLSKNGTIAQETDLGMVYVFHEKFLDFKAPKCLAYCKKNLSSDYRRLLSERMKNINKNKRKMAGRSYVYFR